MKKNKMMRTASALLVATLLTTSIISGTFAKYATEASGKDSARVAKWGVTAMVSGSLFGTNYVAKNEDGTSNEISAVYTGSVDSAASGSEGKSTDNIVAPGTKNSTGVKISISGTPEVANKVTFTSAGKNTTDTNENAEAANSNVTPNQDIYLKVGTYGVMVKAEGVTADNFDTDKYYIVTNGTYSKATGTYSSDTDYFVLKDEVTVGNDGYYPITWTVTPGIVENNSETSVNADTPSTYTKVEDMAKDLSKALSKSNNSLDKIDTEYKITWEWAFEGSGNDKDTVDKEDTILGNLIAGASSTSTEDADDTATTFNGTVVKLNSDNSTYSAPTEDKDYSTKVAFNYKIRVEQVD